MVNNDSAGTLCREASLPGRKADLRADVLKVGHHGSRKATSDQLLARVRPSIAVVSAGVRNPFGFPNRELLSRLDAKKVRVLRTDHHGAVKIVSDGEHLEVIPCVTMAE